MKAFSKALIVSALCAVAVGSLLLAGCGGDDDVPTTASTTAGTRAEPVKASVDALRTVAAAVNHPVYWVPGQQPATYELTQTSDARIFIRYLPDGVELGDPRPNFLTVGTYPQDDAFSTVQTGSKQDGATVVELPNGGLLVSQKDRPTSAFFAFPGAKVLVEVYDPKAGEAARLVTSGAVQPIG